MEWTDNKDLIGLDWAVDSVGPQGPKIGRGRPNWLRRLWMESIGLDLETLETFVHVLLARLMRARRTCTNTVPATDRMWLGDSCRMQRRKRYHGLASCAVPYQPVYRSSPDQSWSYSPLQVVPDMERWNPTNIAGMTVHHLVCRRAILRRNSEMTLQSLLTTW